MIRLDHAARQFLGTPFLHQGRDPAVAIDCVGLLVCCFRLLDWPYDEHDRTDYARRPHGGLLEAHLRAAFGEPLPFTQARPGDIAALRWDGPAVRHVAIIGEHAERSLSLIHTSASVGRVVEQGIDAKWARRIAAVYRPEVSHGR